MCSCVQCYICITLDPGHCIAHNHAGVHTVSGFDSQCKSPGSADQSVLESLCLGVTNQQVSAQQMHACGVWLQRWTHSKVRPSNWPCCTKWSHRLVPSSKGREFLLLYNSKLKQLEPLAVMTEMRELRYTPMWSAYALLCAVMGAPCMQRTASL